MTLNEYERLQRFFSANLKGGWPQTNREEAENNGVLACKSILKEVFNQRFPDRKELEKPEYLYIQERLARKLSGGHGRYLEDYKEGVRQCQESLRLVFSQKVEEHL